MKSILVSLSKVLTLVALLLAIRSQARPTVIDNELILPFEEAPLVHLPPAVRPRSTIAKVIPFNTVGDRLNKRMMPGLPPLYPQTTRLQMASFIKMTSIIPINAMARFLEEFFITIANKADPNGGEWSHLPQRDHFAILEGDFQLSFTCVGDTIPWSFVKEIGLRLWQCAAQGLADLFEVVYTDPAGNIGVKITLSIINAPSGDSNSGGDYREGSVPSITSP